jgi:murein L,D-transpeptidase YafK
MALVAVAGAIALAGCETDDVSQISARALKPLPAALAAEIDKRNMPRESPILVRIFKEESELEVWKQDAEGRFALLKTYPICRWSGELGPKVKEGDRQAPEGFYNITPGQMNPNSNYYLAFNLGFPNAYDRANDHTGAFLMVHGDCSSSGCYAMTDDQIQEIYALGRDSFMGGQKSFQVQAYPFRMTPVNMAKHRNNPAMPFWRMIKEGNDHFLTTRAEPRIDVCEKRYVFDAVAVGNPAAPLTFHPREKCPVFEVPAEIAAAVREKHEADERAFTEYVNRGTATVAVRTGTDGGMHPAFLAKLQPKPLIDFGHSGSDVTAPPGPLPPGVNPPHAPDPDTTSGVAAAPQDGAMSRVGKLFGFGSSEPHPAPEPAPAPALAAAPKPKPAPTQTAAVTPPKPKPTDKPAAKPSSDVAQAGGAPAAPARTPFDRAPPPDPSLMAGATPVVRSGSFEGRWGGMP